MKSYKLLLKNGFKTMFKSKKGFIFIMILTFLLSLVVSVSLTTIKKMSSDFNSVVGNNEKFNSSYSKDSLLKNGNKDVFYPIMDLINPSLYTKQYNYKDKADKDVSINSYDFNFNDVPFIRDTINGNGNDNKIFQLMYPFLTQIKNVRQKRSGIIQWYNFNDLHRGEKFYLIPTSHNNKDGYLIDKPYFLNKDKMKNYDQYEFGEARESLAYDSIFSGLKIADESKNKTNPIFYFNDNYQSIKTINDLQLSISDSDDSGLEKFLFENYNNSKANIMDIFLDLFAKNFFSYLKGKDLKNDDSNIAEFTKNNPGWFNGLAFKNNQYALWSDNFDSNGNFKINNSIDKKYVRMYKYVYYSIQSYVEWLANKAFEFKKVINSKIMDLQNNFISTNSDINNFDYIKSIGTLYATYYFWSVFSINLPYYTFQYTFGKPLDLDLKVYNKLYNRKKFTDDKKNIILVDNGGNGDKDVKLDLGSFNYNVDGINTQDKSSPYEIDLKDFKNNPYWFIGDISKSQKTINDMLLTTGYKGHLNPVYFDSKDWICKFANFTNELQGFSNSENSKNLYHENEIHNYYEILSKTIGVNDIGMYGQNFFGFDYQNANTKDSIIPQNDKDFWKNDDHVDLTNEYFSHSLLVSYNSNVRITKRTELFYSDSSESKEYRIINLDETKTSDNVTTKVLLGKAPVGVNEIGINAQFAKYNKIKVGSIINIGKTSFVVSGILTDTFTFLPSSSSSVPIPSPAKGMVAYLNNGGINSWIANNEGIESQIQSILNIFVYSKNNHDVNKYYERLTDDPSQNQIVLNNINNNNYKENFNSIQNPKSFSDSTFNINWTVYEGIYNILRLFLIFNVLLIVAVTISIMYITISRMIKQNAKTIAILKAQGLGAHIVACQYLWYALPILLLSIPLGTLAGTLLQNVFTGLFKNYLSFDTSSYAFSYLGLFVIIVVMFLVVGILTPLFVATLMIRRPYLKILYSEADSKKIKSLIWFKAKFLSKTSFNKRLSIDLLSSEKKLLGLFFGIIIFSSFVVSSIITIPALTLKIQNNYFKNNQYKNEYTLKDGAVNSPVAQKNINLWSGPDALNSKKINVPYNFDGTTADSTYIYNLTNGFSSSVSNSQFTPYFVYDDKDKTSSTLSKKIINDPGKLFNMLIASLVFNFLNPAGKAISAGIFDQFVTDSFNNADLLKNSKNNTTDKEYEKLRSDIASKIVSSIATLLPNVFSLVKIPNLEFQEGNEWRKQLLSIFTNNAPPYIKQYINRDDRKDITNMGFQTENIVPGKESVATTSAFTQDDLSSSVTGISKTNKSFGMPNNIKNKLFYNDQTTQEIYDLYNGNWTQKEVDDLAKKNIFNKSKNTLEIPIIINKKLERLNHLKIGSQLSDVNFNSNQLVMNTSKYSNLSIPKTAWKYDDTDFAKSNYAKDNKIAKNVLNNSLDGYQQLGDKTYLDAFNIDPNKMTYKKEYDKAIDEVKDVNDNTTLLNNSFMFGNFSYKYNSKGNKEIQSSYLRPYYQWQNFKLFVPTAIFSDINDKSELRAFINPNNMFDKKETDQYGWNADLDSKVLVKGSEVPNDVKRNWKSKLSSSDQASLDGDEKNWVAIRPYDLRPFIGDKGNGYESDELGFMSTSSQNYWLRETINDSSIDFINFKNVNNTSSFNDKKIKVNFKVKDVLEIYNGETILSNIDLINTLIGASNSKIVQFNSSLLDPNSIVKNSKYNYNLYNEKQFPNYVDNAKDSKLISKYTYLNGINTFDYASNMYNNAIFSNIEEPLAMTTGVSLEKKNRDGAITIYDNFKNYDTNISSIDMFSVKKDLFTKATSIVFEISIIFIIILLTIMFITLITNSDIYISKYKNFIVTLKSFGYSKNEITRYTMTIPGVITFVGIIIGYLIMMILANSIVAFLTTKAIIIPFALSPIIPLVTFLIIMLVWFFSTITVVRNLLGKMPYVSLKEMFNE